jgi:two-component system, OmpR family, sensor histidine kinase KdpD
VATVIMEYAVKNNITRIVIGKPKNRWGRLLRRSFVDQVIRQSKQVDVLVVAGEEAPPKLERAPSKRTFRNWRDYLQGLALVALATLLGELIQKSFSPTSIIMIYLLCVAVTAAFWGFGPSILVCIVSVLTWDFFFVPPTMTFAVADTQYVFTFITLALVGIIISYLTTRVRQQSKAAQRRESETATLYSLSRNLAATTGLEATIHAIIGIMKGTFGYSVTIFLPDPQKKEVLKPHVDESSTAIDEASVAAATWSFQHQKITGYGTDTLPSAGGRYMPLSTARGPVGVMALLVTDTAAQFTMQQTQLLEAFADLAAVAIEHTHLAEEVRNTEILKATEKLQTAFLNSISHDLRTPLVSVIGVLSSLQEKGIDFGDDARENLIQVAREEAERLNYFITNLLDVSRIEAGAIKMSLQPSDAEDIIGAALEQLGDRAENRPIKIDLPSNLPLMSVDFGLIVQVLVNILDNALKYSPASSPIEVGGRQVGQQVEITVADHGLGIPSQDLLRVFDKFYRVQRPDNVTGTGLGLAICKGIVEAHGGRISAENRSGDGTIIRFTLPAAEAVPKDAGVRT